jgi:hypothetical protein
MKLLHALLTVLYLSHHLVNLSLYISIHQYKGQDILSRNDSSASSKAKDKTSDLETIHEHPTSKGQGIRSRNDS